MQKWIILFLKGIAMGASDVVPGVSGGTIAFISGIYERLIQAIKSINLANIKLLLKGNFRAFWKNIDGSFLCCLFAGIAVSFLSLAKVITYLINTQPILVWSFFFGLVIASTYFVGKDVKWNVKTLLVFAVFAVLSFFITSPTNAPMNTNGDYWFIFLCGMIAICAMILPGISGSFILLLLGQYEVILKALHIDDFNFTIIALFGCGAAIGIVSFANILTWLFKNYKMLTLAALTGFMFGSLNKIWPWKTTIETYTDRHGIVKPLIQENVLPNGNESSLLLAFLLIVVGLSLIFSIEFVSNKIKHNSK